MANLLSTDGGEAQEKKDAFSWFNQITNGFSSAMSGIGSFFSTLFDVVFWGAVLVGAYYLAKQFQGPIGDFLEKCGLEGAAGPDGFVHQAFVEGDKMIGEAAAAILPAKWVNDIAAKKSPQEVAETLENKGVPKEIVPLVANPKNWKPFFKTVSDAGGKITEPFAGEAGKKVVATVLTQQSQMVKDIIVRLPADAGASADKKTAADLQGAIKGIVNDTTQLKALLVNPQTRDVLVTAVAKFSPVKFTDNGAALNALLAKVAGDDTAIVGVKNLLAPLMDGATVDTAAQVKAATTVLTDPALAGVKGEVNALIQSLNSSNPAIQSAIEMIKNPQIQSMIRAVGPNVAAQLAATDGSPAEMMKVVQANPQALSNIIKDADTRTFMVANIAGMVNTPDSPVKLKDPNALSNYLASIAEQPEAVKSITQLLPVLMGDVLPTEAVAQRDAAIATLLTTQISNPALAPLLKSIELSDAMKNSPYGAALAFINTGENFAKTKTLITAMNDKDGKNVADLLAAIGDDTKMNDLMHKVLQPENATLPAALHTFAAEVNKTTLPKDIQEKLESFAKATPEELKMLSQVPADQLSKVMVALEDLQKAGIDEAVVKQITASSDGAIEALMSEKLATALVNRDVLDDLATVLPLAKKDVPLMLDHLHNTRNAVIDLLIKTDANGAHPNLDAVGNFLVAIEKNENNKNNKPALDALNKRVAKGLVAAFTGKGDAMLNAKDVDAFFSDEKNSTAFNTMLHGFDVKDIPAVFADKQKLITALKKHFYVPEVKNPDGTIVKPAGGLVFILSDEAGAKFLVDKLNAEPVAAETDAAKAARYAAAPTAATIQDFFSFIAKQAGALVQSNKDVRDVAVALKQLPSVVSDNMDHLNAVQAALPQVTNAPPSVASR
jgi:hypothetical protein